MKSYVIIGGNMGDRMAYLQQARRLLEENCGSFLCCSSIYETAPWGKTDQEPFLNQALGIDTHLLADELMSTILSIEEKMGRVRSEKNGPRIIDIDILFYEERVIRKPSLTIPHPELQHRRFVLTPLSEIAPNLLHPVLNKNIEQLLEECEDMLPVKKL